MAGAPDPRWRRRFELALRVIAPGLDLALACGDRLSRVLHREPPAPVPVRMTGPGHAAPRGLRSDR